MYSIVNEADSNKKKYQHNIWSQCIWNDILLAKCICIVVINAIDLSYTPNVLYFIKTNSDKLENKKLINISRKWYEKTEKQ